MSNAIEIKGLKKTYSNGTQALKGIDLEIKQGDFFALLGANGAGKTTAIGVLTGVVVKTAGSVKIFGIDIEKDHASAKKFIGVVPQELNFSIFELVEDIVVSQAGYFGIRRKEALVEAEFILKKLDLWSKRKQPARTLSGGMKRRLMIARALIHKPKLLILDEPTAGVDVELRYGMWDYLRELNQNGTTILLTTHYLEEVEQMCKNAAIIKTGEIVALDSVRNMIRLVDQETYVVHVDHVKPINRSKLFNPKTIDDNTLEIDLFKTQKISDCLSALAEDGMILTDIRPKGNRMEKLFLKILKQ
jgi:ABC-2 type transport system ATP-binding protein